jgi:adenosylcobyric acid synthase
MLPPPYPKTYAIILPGSRLTRSDLNWHMETGWGRLILEHVDRVGAVFGLCGGYQILGRTFVRNEVGIEGVSGTSEGLGLLPIDSVISSSDEKVVTPRTALLNGSEKVHGFELHCGQMTRAPGTETLLHILDTNEDMKPRAPEWERCPVATSMEYWEANMRDRYCYTSQKQRTFLRKRSLLVHQIP